MDLPRGDASGTRQKGERENAPYLQEFAGPDHYRSSSIACHTICSAFGAAKASRGKASLAQGFARWINPALCKATRAVDVSLQAKRSDLAEGREGQWVKHGRATVCPRRAPRLLAEDDRSRNSVIQIR